MVRVPELIQGWDDVFKNKGDNYVKQDLQRVSN